MKNCFTQKFVIDETQCDAFKVVPITELFRLAEICAFTHADMIGLDHDSMENKSGAFWVVSKMKLFLNKKITVGDKVKVKTWTMQPGLIRADRNIVIKVGNSNACKFSTEWCALDMGTHKVRKLSSICYPELEMTEAAEIKADYTNLRLPVTEKDLVYTKTIRATDLDLNFHTNNLKYNFIALDAFSIDELKTLNFKEWEIYFVNESHEGDKIDVYKTKQKNCYYLEGRVADKPIFRVVAKFKKI